MSEESPVSRALSSFDAAMKAGRPAQAYLVVGNIREEGIPFAEAALSRLFCQGLIPPCGDCAACDQVRERKHVDVVWIEPEKKSRVVGVDRIRELQRLIYQTSYSGGWKAVVLVGADRIGEEAANAFLKTLEEPPPRCLYFLLSESPQNIMATILSRCQRLILSTEAEVLPEPWQEELLEILAEPLAGGLMARLQRGSRLDKLLGAIKKTVESEETERYREEQEALRNPDDKRRPTKADEEVLPARIEARYRGLRAMALRTMLFWYRDILLSVCDAGGAALRYPDRMGAITAAAATISYGEALANVRTIEGMHRQFDRNVPGDAVIYNAMGAFTA